MSLEVRAAEIAEFLNEDEALVLDRLQKGFHYNHAAVAEDFRNASPHTDEELLDWYRCTTAYVYELSIYHGMAEDYDRMCMGAAIHLKNADKKRVLALGDGIGDLSLTLHHHGLKPVYHDLEGSITARFASFRFQKAGAKIATCLTSNWDPKFRKNSYDAIVAYDFIEHIPDHQIEQWARSLYGALRMDGIFQFQNAFGIGLHNMEGGQSSIPMHEASGEHWVEDWEPLLQSIGFLDEGNGWWRK